mgnify:CR=1 FL=1
MSKSGEQYMKKLFAKFERFYNDKVMETAGISTSAGLFPQEENQKENMIKVGFICNAGFGSSAMGATLFRKKLQELGITGVDVRAYPLDQIPEDLELAVCQKDFQKMTGAELKAEGVCTVENLLDQSEYMEIAKMITQIIEKG